MTTLTDRPSISFISRSLYSCFSASVPPSCHHSLHPQPNQITSDGLQTLTHSPVIHCLCIYLYVVAGVSACVLCDVCLCCEIHRHIQEFIFRSHIFRGCLRKEKHLCPTYSHACQSNTSLSLYPYS